MSSPENNSKKTQFKPGNKAAVKLDSSQKRLKAFEAYCVHISSGLPKEAFYFDDAEASCCHKTMEKYIVEHAAELPLHLLEKAKASRYKFWFCQGMNLMRGEYRNGSPVVWQTIMRNMFRDYNWDREIQTEDHKGHVLGIAQALRLGPISEAAGSDTL